jgi:hypothetical protein
VENSWRVLLSLAKNRIPDRMLRIGVLLPKEETHRGDPHDPAIARKSRETAANRRDSGGSEIRRADRSEFRS